MADIAQSMKDKISLIWPGATIIVGQDKNTTTIEVDKMYDYVNCGLAELLAVARAINTDKFDVDQTHVNGCETCDYGSRYIKIFTFKHDNVGVWGITLPQLQEN